MTTIHSAIMLFTPMQDYFTGTSNSVPGDNCSVTTLGAMLFRVCFTREKQNPVFCRGPAHDVRQCWAEFFLLHDILSPHRVRSALFVSQHGMRFFGSHGARRPVCRRARHAWDLGNVSPKNTFNVKQTLSSLATERFCKVPKYL